MKKNNRRGSERMREGGWELYRAQKQRGREGGKEEGEREGGGREGGREGGGEGGRDGRKEMQQMRT